MKAVRDRAEARWLPSRFRHATFKLLAYAILRRSKPRQQRGLVLIIDRDQSALEHYTLAAYGLATASCYVAAVLSIRYHAALVLIASLPLAALAIETPLYLHCLTASHKRAIALHTLLSWVLLTAAAAYFATWQNWVRIPARLFLVVLGINGASAFVLRLLRGRIAAAEAAYGVTP